MSQHQCRRGPWSNAEDQMLMQLVQQHGALNWVRISQTLGSRTPKQCRERYHQNLKPSLNHEPISPEEGLQIERLVGEVGKRWAEIARRLNGRSDNAVKNWWNGSQNRRRRQDRRRVTHSGDGHFEPHHTLAPPPHRHSIPPSGYHYQRRSLSDHQHYFIQHPSRSVSDSLPAPGAFSSSRPSVSAPQALRLPTLPPPQSAGSHCPVPGRPYHRLEQQPHQAHRVWGEAPLPSPCSSDGADSEFAPSYVTSPTGHQNSHPRHPASGVTADQRQPLLLPPLSSSSNATTYASSALAQMAPCTQTMVVSREVKEQSGSRLGDLPTAPNSPESLDNGRQVMERKDPRMNLTSLLA